MTESMASEPAEPTTRPQDDVIEQAARALDLLAQHTFSCTTDPRNAGCDSDEEPCTCGMPVSDWTCHHVDVLANAGMLADPAQTTGLQARLDAALAELAKYEPSPGCCTACNGVGTVPTGYPCEDCYATGHCHDEAVSCDGMAVDAADPAQTTELEQADLSGGEADAAADPTLPVDPSQRALAWCRQWMATRETVHKRTAERDLLRWLHAEKAHHHAALLAQRDQWWDHVGRERAQLEAERDERQARIDAVLQILDEPPPVLPRTDPHFERMNARNARTHLVERVRAALAGDQPTADDRSPLADRARMWLEGQPKAEEPKPRCCIGPFADGSHAPGCLDACQDCGGNVAEPRRCRCRDAPRAVEEADDVAEPACECFVVPEEQWTRHYDATEPGSMVEQNPDCPVHPAKRADDAAGDLP